MAPHGDKCPLLTVHELILARPDNLAARPYSAPEASSVGRGTQTAATHDYA